MPAYRVLSLPYVFSDSDEAYAILNGRDRPARCSTCSATTACTASAWGADLSNARGSRTPGGPPVEDLQGLKIRVLPTRASF